MNNFGVIEVASARTTNAPGWAYVPVTGPAKPLLAPNSSGAALNPSRKRARNQAKALSSADLDARQEARVRKELEALDRENNQRDVHIAVPAKPSSSRGGGTQNSKHTPNVRKILQSQKTFANHLDDYLALEQGGNAGAAAIRGGKGGAAGPRKADTTSLRPRHSATVKQGEDVEMADAPAEDSASSTILAPYNRPRPATHPADGDALLVSRVPPMPTDDELRDLMAAPPPSYLEARAGWSDEDRKYPVRVFCEVCGYWGRVKCMKCGMRVCALECLETHREECVTRYGL